PLYFRVSPLHPPSAALPTLSLHDALPISVRPLLDATSVYPVPALSIESPENVATPLTAATVAVPDSVPPPGLAPIATVMLPVNPVAVFPCPSWADTCTAGVMFGPATVMVG